MVRMSRGCVRWRLLARAGTPLTMCPLSNIRLRCVDTLADHPLPAFLEAGVLVTVNSDDPAYFGGYADTNYEAQRATFVQRGGDGPVGAQLGHGQLPARGAAEGAIERDRRLGRYVTELWAEVV